MLLFRPEMRSMIFDYFGNPEKPIFSWKSDVIQTILDQFSIFMAHLKGILTLNEPVTGTFHFSTQQLTDAHCHSGKK